MELRITNYELRITNYEYLKCHLIVEFTNMDCFCSALLFSTAKELFFCHTNRYKL